MLKVIDAQQAEEVQGGQAWYEIGVKAAEYLEQWHPIIEATFERINEIEPAPVEPKVEWMLREKGIHLQPTDRLGGPATPPGTPY